jgi:hypothetical protein
MIDKEKRFPTLTHNELVSRDDWKGKCEKEKEEK